MIADTNGRDRAVLRQRVFGWVQQLIQRSRRNAPRRTTSDAVPRLERFRERPSVIVALSTVSPGASRVTRQTTSCVVGNQMAEVSMRTSRDDWSHASGMRSESDALDAMLPVSDGGAEVAELGIDQRPLTGCHVTIPLPKCELCDRETDRHDHPQHRDER